MGQQQSKEELLYEQVLEGNVEAIKALCAEGAGLEWIGKDGKTPLIVACMNPELFIVAQILIKLGANINYYRPGCHAGTPLHHAAKRGLAKTVKLLLSHGANPLVRNDDSQTPLDVARTRGFNNVVRAIESHICFFSGWLREFYGPGFLEALAPQFLSRKIWVVILPRGTQSLTKPPKIELVIYSTPQDAQPRTVIALWMATIEEPKFHQPDPTLILIDKSTKTRYKFASANDGDKQQLQMLYNACRGVPQATLPPVPHDTQISAPAIANQAAAEAAELAMAINASIQSAMEDRLVIRPTTHQTSEANNASSWGDTANVESHNGWGPLVRPPPSEASSNDTAHNGWAPLVRPPPSEASSSDTSHNGWDPLVRPPPSESSSSNTGHNGWAPLVRPPPSEASSSNTGHKGWAPLVKPRPSEATSNGWIDEPANDKYNGWGVPESTPAIDTNQNLHTTENIPSVVQTSITISATIPSAPPVLILEEGPILYPSIDLSPVDFSFTSMGDDETSRKSEEEGVGGSSSCIICWEAPVEGACIPCGHMAGCMSCLNEIKTKKGDCPVCRAKMDQVVRLYAV